MTENCVKWQDYATGWEEKRGFVGMFSLIIALLQINFYLV